MMERILTVQNPRWAESNHSAVTVDVTTDFVSTPSPMVCRASDPPTAPYFANALDGDYGPIGEYIPPPEPEPEPEESE